MSEIDLIQSYEEERNVEFAAVFETKASPARDLHPELHSIKLADKHPHQFSKRSYKILISSFFMHMILR